MAALRPGGGAPRAVPRRPAPVPTQPGRRRAVPPAGRPPAGGRTSGPEWLASLPPPLAVGTPANSLLPIRYTACTATPQSVGDLLTRAPPGRPAADRSVYHFGAAARAPAAGMPGRDDVTGVHAAVRDGRPHGGLHGAVETVGVLRLEAVDARRGRPLCLPGRLVRQQVPDSADFRLVEQAVLNGDRPLHDPAPELPRRYLLAVLPERVDVGVEPYAPPTALVEQHQTSSLS